MVAELSIIENEISFLKSRIVELETIVLNHKRAERATAYGKDPYQEITMMLLDLGIPAHILGYRYLREAIMMVLENRDYLGQITKNLYPELAEKFKTTGSKVERAIRHAIEVAFSRKNTGAMQTIIGYQPINKPTNSEFIAIIVDVIMIKHRGV